MSASKVGGDLIDSILQKRHMIHLSTSLIDYIYFEWHLGISLY